MSEHRVLGYLRAKFVANRADPDMDSCKGASASIDELASALQAQYGHSVLVHPAEVREVVSSLQERGRIKSSNPFGTCVEYVPLRERAQVGFNKLVYTLVTETLSADAYY